MYDGKIHFPSKVGECISRICLDFCSCLCLPFEKSRIAHVFLLKNTIDGDLLDEKQRHRPSNASVIFTDEEFFTFVVSKLSGWIQIAPFRAPFLDTVVGCLQLNKKKKRGGKGRGKKFDHARQPSPPELHQAQHCESNIN